MVAKTGLMKLLILTATLLAFGSSYAQDELRNTFSKMPTQPKPRPMQ